MLDVQCPYCQKALSLGQRKGLILRPAIPCIHCGGMVRVKQNIVYLNSGLLGTMLGINSQLFLKLSLDLIICIGLFAIFFLQPFIDILYSLEPAEDDFDF